MPSTTAVHASTPVPVRSGAIRPTVDARVSRPANSTAGEKPTTAPTGRPTTPGGAPTAPSAGPTAAVGLVNTSGRDLALAGTATASSVEPPGVFGTRNVNDGDADTRWGSEFQSDPQWIAVDLGDVWQVTEIKLRWEAAYATAYRVEVSVDGAQWRTVYRTSRGAGGDVELSIGRIPSRYVRMVGTARVADRYGYSLSDFEVR